MHMLELSNVNTEYLISIISGGNRDVFLRRLLKVSWKDKVASEEVLRKANVDRKLTECFRRMKFFGHIVRKEELE